MLHRLLVVLKNYMMLEVVLDRLPDLLEGLIDRISRIDNIPEMEWIPDMVLLEILRLVQRAAERYEDEEEDEEEEEDPKFIREE